VFTYSKEGEKKIFRGPEGHCPKKITGETGGLGGIAWRKRNVMVETRIDLGIDVWSS